MALAPTTVPVGDHQIAVGTAGPLVQASTNATVVLTGSDIDARGYKALSFTITVITNDVKWSIFGANVSDFSDEVVLLVAVSVVATASSSQSYTPPPFAFYRVKIIDTVGNTHGTATVNIIAKP